MKPLFHLTGAASRWADTRASAIIVWVLRVVVGCTFIFSGLAKAIDLWGGCYKFTEYFNAFGWTSMVPLAMACAFALALAEFLLGLFTLTGCYRRGTLVLLTLMMLVMLPLTAWLWHTNAIADCGCFGDAVKLTNGQTFAKNLLLLPAIVYLLLFNRRVHGIYGPAVNWAVALLGTLYVAAIGAIGYLEQPLVDFRSYPVGSRIAAVSDTDNNDEDYLFTYEKDGRQQDFTIDNLPDDDSGWTYVNRHLRKEAAAKIPDIIHQPLAVFDHGSEVTEEVLPESQDVMIFTFTDLADANLAFSFNLNELAERAQQQGVLAWAAVDAPDSIVARWADESHARYPLYTIDDTDIKSLARGNPAVVYVHQGHVAWKRTLASLDSARISDKSLPVGQVGDDGHNGHTALTSLTLLLLIMLVLLLVLNRTHVAVVAVARLFKKKPKLPAAEQQDDAPQE